MPERIVFAFDNTCLVDAQVLALYKSLSAAHEVHRLFGCVNVNELQALKVNAYWSNVAENVVAAREAGISACYVGHEPHNITHRQLIGGETEFLQWGLKVAP